MVPLLLGEIAGVRGDWPNATACYQAALAETGSGGASFITGVATVGLLSAQVANNDHDAALDGYLNLVNHYERTGGWNFQWTVLRNVADLLERRSNPEAAMFLRLVTSNPPNFVGDQPGPTREQVVAKARHWLRRPTEFVGQANDSS